MGRSVAIWFLIMFVGRFISAQNLYIPPNAVITIDDGALLHAEGDIENTGLIGGIAAGSLATESQLSNSGIIGLAVDSDLNVGSHLLNEGSITSSGTIHLGGDWTNNNVTNLVDATLVFNGFTSQLFTDNEMLISGITMDAIGPVTLDVPLITVSNQMGFQSGILLSVTDKSIILDQNADATGGSETSYYNGTLISRGTGFKYFPVGNNGHFGPVEFDNIDGIDPEIAVRHIWTNPYDPVPGDDLIGVSSNGLWAVEHLAGSFDGSRIFFDFMDEDLVNFSVSNDIDATYNSPVIAYADSAGGVFESLSVSNLEDTDSVSFGRILSDSLLIFSDTSNIRYLAIAKAPLIPPQGVVYIPEVFSPNASNPLNQSFRFFGERIVSEDFSMRIYNRKRILVYETTDLQEARRVGWDGTNKNTGKDEPSGAYFYHIIYRVQPLGENPREPLPKIGQVFLIR